MNLSIFSFETYFIRGYLHTVNLCQIQSSPYSTIFNFRTLRIYWLNLEWTFETNGNTVSKILYVFFMFGNLFYAFGFFFEFFSWKLRRVLNIKKKQTPIFWIFWGWIWQRLTVSLDLIFTDWRKLKGSKFESGIFKNSYSSQNRQ